MSPPCHSGPPFCSSNFCRWYHGACGDVDDEACCLLFPRSWAINTSVALFRFPRSDVWLFSGLWCPCWPRFERSPRGRLNLQCGGAVHIEGSLQGDRESLQSGPILFPALRSRFEFVVPVRVGLLACELLGRVSGSMARQAESRIRGTLSAAWDAPCSPFRRFKS